MQNTRNILIERLVILTLFAVAFAYIEAAVVVYLRAIFYTDSFTFPITNLLELPGSKELLFIEIGREAATFVLIFTASWLLAEKFRHRFETDSIILI